jgi:hypothetical protein
MIRFALLTGLVLSLLGCGGSNLGGPCQATCDCKETGKPLSCSGEWNCNAQKTCEFTCKSTCSNGAPSTCRDSDECNGTICSSRLTCQ